MLPPKRFKQNTTKATEIKRNGTEAIGIDQDGIAKSIDIEVLMTKDNVGLGKVVNKTESELVASGAIADALALKFDKSSLADNYDGGATKALSAEKGKDLNARVSDTDDAISAIKGAGWTDENLVDHESRLDTLEADDTTEGSIAYDIKQSSDALKGVDYTEGTLKTHEDRLDTLEGADTLSGSVAKTVKDAVTPIDTRVTYLESVRGHLYGVRMQKISGICSPTYDAIGLEFRPQIDTITNPSDFSSVYPWRDIKTVKVDENKNILCTIDDADFESTVGDIMVKIPVFWHRYWTDANYEYYEISDTPRDGFFAGGFYNPDMTIRPYALVGAVKTSNDGRIPHSWTDTPFTHSLPLYSTTAGFQIDALNKSSTNKWSNIDHQAYEMVWHLIFVEIGGYKISPNTNVLGFDVKGVIGQGINGMTNSYNASNVCTVATVGANTFIMAKTRSQYFKVGMLVQIGTAISSQNIADNRYITDISEYDATNDVITVDGASFTTTLTSTIATWAQPLPLAQLMALKNESGYVLQFDANNLSHVCYRGIWDLWGNMYEWMSGLYRYDLQFYACFDWTKMNVSDPRGVAGWVATGIAPNVANGYLKTRQVYKGALGEIGLPAATGAGSATWYAAYAYYFNDGYMGLRAVLCGGHWNNGAAVGFFWVGYNAPSTTSLYVGGRLIG